MAPLGWHIPSDSEWAELVNCLGGDSVAGGKLKTIGTIEGGDGLWESPNIGATNESGFSALPGGMLWVNCDWFANLGITGYWWTSTEGISTTFVWCWELNNDLSNIYRVNYTKVQGLSIRCVKDK